METRLFSWACRFLLIFGVLLLESAPSSMAGESMEKANPGQGSLDGKTFTVDTGDMGKSASDKDVLVFKDGKFHSTGCDQYGFGDGAYMATVKGDTVTFESETTSPTKGKMNWRGTVQGDKIEVSYVWTDSAHWYKPNPKPLEKWGKGELKK